MFAYGEFILKIPLHFHEVQYVLDLKLNYYMRKNI